MSHKIRERKRARSYKETTRIKDAERETVRYERAVRPRRVTQLKVSRLPLSYQGRRVTKAEYARYLESSHWRAFRERFLAEARLQECFVCGDGAFDLHHLTYERLWAERIDDVMPLCRYCHHRVHNIVKRAKLSLARAPIYLKARSPKERESYD